MTSGKLFDSLNPSFPDHKMGIISQGYGGSLKEVMNGNLVLSSSSSIGAGPSPQPLKSGEARGLKVQECLNVNPSFTTSSLCNPQDKSLYLSVPHLQNEVIIIPCRAAVRLG